MHAVRSLAVGNGAACGHAPSIIDAGAPELARMPPSAGELPEVMPDAPGPVSVATPVVVARESGSLAG